MTLTAGRSESAGSGLVAREGLRVGIVNLMPRAEQYERWLMPQLAAGPRVEAV